MEFMDADYHSSVNDSKNMIQGILNMFDRKEGINWVIEMKETGLMVGYAGFIRIDYDNCRSEIGYALKPGFWREGIMFEALYGIIKYGFNILKMHSMEANVNPLNNNSIKLLEKLKFRKEAYFRENYYFNGKFLDSVIYSLLETDMNL
jgi:ribosomal-protein-alanine N-acetyltransferase